MSGYGDTEALWLTRVRAVAGFSATNTNRGDWGILNAGTAAVYAVLKPGEHTREMLSLKTRLNIWQTIIEVWQKYRDDGTTLTDLETNVNNIIAAIDEFPRLGDVGGAIQQGQIVAVREVIQNPADAPSWLMAAIIGEAREEITINFQE